MTTDTQRLAAQLATATRSHVVGWLWHPLLTRLAEGEPVPAEALAADTGTTVAQIRQALVALPDTEYDEQGRIVGSGITLRPTPHSFEVGGERLFTWCALDTLVFPAVLGRSARVASPCHATGTAVRATVHPDRVADVQPPTAVVSLVAPGDDPSIRATFCNEVHFFASPAAATSWLEQHPGGVVRPVAEAFDLGRPLVETLLAEGGSPSHCCG